MATLTETAKTVRITVNIILAVFVIFIGYRVTVKIIQSLLPKPPIEPPKPTLSFGQLPYPTFEDLDIRVNSEVLYDLDLITASLPSAPNIIPVFKKVPYTTGLLSVERAKTMAKNFNFDPEQYKELSLTEYEWTDTEHPRTMTINLTTRKFNIAYDYKKDPSVFTEVEFRSDTSAASRATQILSSGRMLPEDISKGKKLVTLMTWKDNQLTEAERYDQTNAARIHLQRDDITITSYDEEEYIYPIVGETPTKGPITMIISSNTETKKNILDLDFNYFSIDQTDFGTYYLKPSQQAWAELQAGEGHIVQFDLPEEPNYEVIDIKKVYLAYFDQSGKQDYLQPIWVFEGESTMRNREKVDYVAYIPALNESSYDKNQIVE